MVVIGFLITLQAYVTSLVEESNLVVGSKKVDVEAILSNGIELSVCGTRMKFYYSMGKTICFTYCSYTIVTI